tara:strand:- start:3576 stop:4103 length:528 start_codon:yes stop_codon:yes gene_type:complete
MAQARMNFSTPLGTAQYPWLNKADTKFDEEGVFKTNLIVPHEDAKDLVGRINEFAKEQLGNKLSKAMMPYESDPDTGDVIFKTKSKFAPKFKDSAGQLIVGDSVPQLWGGSVIRVAGTLTAYDKGVNVGVKLNLGAVQVIQPAETTNGGDDFGAVEGGFVATKESKETDEFSDDF